MGIMNKMKTVDLGTLNWTLYKPDALTPGYFYASLPAGYMDYPNERNKDRFAVSTNKYTNGNSSQAYYDDKVITIGCSWWRPGCVNIHDSDYSTAAALKESLQGVILTYETVDSVEEKIVSNPRFTYTGARWAQEWYEVKSYLASLKPGTYKVRMRATLTSKTANWGRGDSKFGIYLNPPLTSERRSWEANDEVGKVREASFNLIITQPTFNFYIYGCGIEGIGASGTADIELTIINPYTEEII